MSDEDRYYNLTIKDRSFIAIGKETVTVTHNEEIITTDTMEIYDALVKVRGEVELDTIKIVTKNDCRGCDLYSYDELGETKFCLAITDKCPGAGNYSVILRKECDGDE